MRHSNGVSENLSSLEHCLILATGIYTGCRSSGALSEAHWVKFLYKLICLSNNQVANLRTFKLLWMQSYMVVQKIELHK